MLPDLDTVVFTVISTSALVLHDILAAEFERNGVCCLGAGFCVVLKVIERDVAAKILDYLDNRLCNLALVEALFAFCC